MGTEWQVMLLQNQYSQGFRTLTSIAQLKHEYRKYLTQQFHLFVENLKK